MKQKKTIKCNTHNLPATSFCRACQLPLCEECHRNLNGCRMDYTGNHSLNNKILNFRLYVKGSIRVIIHDVKNYVLDIHPTPAENLTVGSLREAIRQSERVILGLRDLTTGGEFEDNATDNNRPLYKGHQYFIILDQLARKIIFFYILITFRFISGSTKPSNKQSTIQFQKSSIKPTKS